ncbi:FAD-dependent oxidoreductase, partial [bacterium]|nr:FAD-dependent oxidoreductase [bacterium]
MKETLHCERVIIGGGVIGLAVAARIGTEHTYLFERHPRFGMENSSRNSEVVHSGIYYPAESFKTQLCVEGRARLYAFSERHAVPYRRCGKVVVATTPAEQESLHRL